MADPQPLAGLRIAVTRPQPQAGALAAGISKLGGSPILFPLLEITPPADPLALQQLATRLHEFQTAIFISPNAVQYGLPLLQGRLPAALQVVAVGGGTAQALRAAGITRVLAPAQGADSEALLALPQLQALGGQRILILRGDHGRELLGDTLQARGARVEYAACYQRKPPSQPPTALLQAKPDMLTISSSEALRNLHAMLSAEQLAQLCKLPLFVIHERIAVAARALGWQNIVTAGAGDEAQLAALAAWAMQKQRGK